MAGAVAALHAVGVDYTVFGNPDGVAYLDGTFLFPAYGPDGSRRADIGTGCTLRTAISAVEFHFGLHEGVQLRGRTENPFGTLRHTELTGRAMLGEMSYSDRSGGYQAGGARGQFLILDSGQAAVDGLAGTAHYSRPGCRRSGNHEGAASGVYPRGLISGGRFYRPGTARKTDGVFGTFIDAVHTGHASAEVDRVVDGAMPAR